MPHSISEHLDARVRALVDTGRYASAGEVLEVALNLLEERDAFYEHRMERLKREVQRGIDQLDRGETVPFDPDRIRRKGRELLAERRRREAPKCKPRISVRRPKSI